MNRICVRLSTSVLRVVVTLVSKSMIRARPVLTLSYFLKRIFGLAPYPRMASLSKDMQVTPRLCLLGLTTGTGVQVVQRLKHLENVQV